MALVGWGESTWLKEKNSGSLKIVEYELAKWKCKEKKKVKKNRTECKRTVEQYQKIYHIHNWNARRRKRKWVKRYLM